MHLGSSHVQNVQPIQFVPSQMSIHGSNFSLIEECFQRVLLRLLLGDRLGRDSHYVELVTEEADTHFVEVLPSDDCHAVLLYQPIALLMVDVIPPISCNRSVIRSMMTRSRAIWVSN